MEVKVIPDPGIDNRYFTYGKALPRHDIRIIPVSDRK
jgi:hypothetical protein